LFRSPETTAPAPAPTPAPARQEATRNKQDNNRRNEQRTRGENPSQQRQQQREGRGGPQGKTQNQQRQRQEQQARQPVPQGKQEQQRQPKSAQANEAATEPRNKQPEQIKQAQQERQPRAQQSERTQQQPAQQQAPKPVEVQKPAAETTEPVANVAADTTAATTPIDTNAAIESTGQARRRRGRRGGRRRRRHEGAATGTVQNEELTTAQDLDDEDRDDPFEADSQLHTEAGPSRSKPSAATEEIAPTAQVHERSAVDSIMNHTEAASAHAQADLVTANVTANNGRASAPSVIAPATAPTSFNLPVLPPIPVGETVVGTEALAEQESVRLHDEATVVHAETVTVTVSSHEPESAVNEEAIVAESGVIAEAVPSNDPVLMEPTAASISSDEPVAVPPTPIVHQPEQGDLLSAPLRQHTSAHEQENHDDAGAPLHEDENSPINQQRDGRS
jgi:ribonuclease E